MKIVFICGSLETGKDGVGDYTRRLTTELIRHGHEVGIIAIRDKYISKLFIGIQQSECIDIPIIRLPLVLTAMKRFSEAKKWIDQFNPEWLSLQYVPFTFQKKGLPFGLSKHLKWIAGKRKWHIMFHELWLGMEKEASLKQILWGVVQKNLIRFLISKLKAKVIHTQSRLYQTQLKRIKIISEHLPLFSNFVNTNNDVNKSIYGTFPSAIRPNEKIHHKFILFGAVHPGAPINEFIKDISHYKSETGCQFELTIIGRNSQEQMRWASAWRSAGLDVRVMGEQNPENISEEFANATLGISTTPIQLIEKSAAIAVVREHRLPILCISRPWHARGIKTLSPIPGILDYDQDGLQLFLEGNFNLPITYQVSEISRSLTNRLLETI